MSAMPLDPITLASILRSLPGMQQAKTKATRDATTRDNFIAMGQRPSQGNYTPTQQGGLYQTVGKYNTDYGKIGNDILGGLGSDYFGRKAERSAEAAANMSDSEIMRTVEQFGQTADGKGPAGGATEETLRGYLGMLGGPDAQGLLGSKLRVQSRYVNENGDVVALMSDGSRMLTGDKADYSVNVIQNEGQEPFGYGRSGAGRNRIFPAQTPGQQPTPINPSAPAPFGPMDSAPGAEASLYDRIRWTESAGDDGAVSPAGAIGPMQLMPDTARYLEKSLGLPEGSTDTDPAANFEAGKAYIDQRIEARNGNEALALMDYNWGQGNVNKWIAAGSDPNAIPTETQNFIQRVQAGRKPGESVPEGRASAAASTGVLAPGQSPYRKPTTYETSAAGQQAKIDVAAANVGTQAAVDAQIRGTVMDAENAANFRKLLPQIETSLATAENVSKQLLEHPGLSDITGASALARVPDGLTARAYVNAVMAGTPAADAFALHDQLKGKVFLAAYESLKGGGQITEIEGNKAEQALARMSRAQTTDAYKQAVRDFMDALRAGQAKIRAAAQLGTTPAPAPATNPALPAGFEWVDE